MRQRNTMTRPLAAILLVCCLTGGGCPSKPLPWGSVTSQCAELTLCSCPAPACAPAALADSTGMIPTNIPKGTYGPGIYGGVAAYGGGCAPAPVISFDCSGQALQLSSLSYRHPALRAGQRARSSTRAKQLADPAPALRLGVLLRPCRPPCE